MYWQYRLAQMLNKGLGEIQDMTRHEFNGWFVYMTVASKRAEEGLL